MIPTSESVIAVPPLCRDAAWRLAPAENNRLMQHLRQGGVRILLYGGNANFYHLRPSEYAATLAMLAECGGRDLDIIPSAGPGFGWSMDQASILRDFAFPTVMVLPHTGFNTPDGVATGLRHFAEALGQPIVVYLKAENYLTPALTAALVRDGLVSWVKYAIVREDPARDPWLDELSQAVDPARIVSGMGEQPAIQHLRDRKFGGFTAGCVCVAPRLSTRLLHAARAGDWVEAERVRSIFAPLEALRDGIHPVRVLHEAVALAGLAETGPILPLLGPLSAEQAELVRSAAHALLAAEKAA
jgi:dihydrodipicolinate synthase/N-acetylneuraminate lyase